MKQSLSVFALEAALQKISHKIFQFMAFHKYFVNPCILYLGVLCFEKALSQASWLVKDKKLVK